MQLRYEPNMSSIVIVLFRGFIARYQIIYFRRQMHYGLFLAMQRQMPIGVVDKKLPLFTHPRYVLSTLNLSRYRITLKQSSGTHQNSLRLVEATSASAINKLDARTK